MPELGERVATVEQVSRDMQREIDDVKREQERTRKRLHDTEGLLGLLVDQQKQNRAQEARQYRRIEVRMQMLTIVVMVGTLALSLVIALTHTAH